MITLRHTTVGRTPLDERPVRRRLLPDNTQHSQETDFHTPAEFEPTILASERPQTQALDRAATGIGVMPLKMENKCVRVNYMVYCYH